MSAVRIGLSGIGSGKSTVSRRLAELGAVIIDADRIARQVVEPGTPGLAALRTRFGDEIIDADGALIRPKLGQIAFADPTALADLNAITHPLIGRRTAELIAQAPADAVLVHDVPLLVENGLHAQFDLVVIVHASVETRVRRLVEFRGWTRPMPGLGSRHRPRMSNAGRWPMSGWTTRALRPTCARPSIGCGPSGSCR